MMPHALQMEELTIAEFIVDGRQAFLAISVPHRFALRLQPTLIGIGPRMFRAVLSVDGIPQSPLWYREPRFCAGSVFVGIESTPDNMRGFWCRRCGGITDILCALEPGNEACEQCARSRSSAPIQTLLLQYQGRLFELDPRPTRAKPTRVPLHLLRSWQGTMEIHSALRASFGGVVGGVVGGMVGG